MARIRSFDIRGLAGRRNAVRYELDVDVAVFWGLNGSGKTSLLKILHSALSDDATTLLRVPFTAAEVRIWDEYTDVVYTRKITKKDLEQDSQFVFEDESEPYIYEHVTLAGQVIRHTNTQSRWTTTPELPPRRSPAFRHGYLPISRISEARGRRGRRSAADLLDEAAFDRLFAQQVQELWTGYNQRALTQIRESQERGLARILTSVLATRRKEVAPPVTNPQVAYKLVKDFFAEQRLGAMVNLGREAFIRNYEKNALVQEVVAEVADVQRGIDLAQEPQRRIEQLLGDLYAGGKQVVLQGREIVVEARGEAVPLESLSSGEKQMLQLLLECLAAGPSAVIVDEPELSLHVDWQNRLIDCMRTVNDSAQLILATHSPEVMANLPDSSIFEL